MANPPDQPDDDDTDRELARARARYQRDVQSMIAAANAWRCQHPTAPLVFVPLGVPASTVIMADLDESVIDRTAGTSHTLELLRAMDAACEHRGTIMQAETCLELVFGIPRALTVRPIDRVTH
jgi:hypothetical protein